MYDLDEGQWPLSLIQNGYVGYAERTVGHRMAALDRYARRPGEDVEHVPVHPLARPGNQLLGWTRSRAIVERWMRLPQPPDAPGAIAQDAMWSVDPSAGFNFSDATDAAQMTLFTREPNYAQMKHQIQGRFSGAGAVRVEDLETFVVVETAFRETHYKRQILGPMEKDRGLEVTVSPRKRRGSYPNGTVIRFP